MERIFDFFERRISAIAAIGLALWAVLMLTLLVALITGTVRFIQGVC